MLNGKLSLRSCLGLKTAIALAIVMIDGDRHPCVTSAFIVECIWRSDWVAEDKVDGRKRLLAGFKDIPEPLPTSGVHTYWRRAWIFEAQPRNKRRKTLKERRTNQE